MASTTLVLLSIIGLNATFIITVDANAFLRGDRPAEEERISEAEVEATLLSEIENAFGEGAASSRVKQLEAILGSIYAASPKNEQGYLDHATVRYALHRLFVQRHGWVVKGLDASGGYRKATSGAGLLKEQVPAYIHHLFEKRLGGRGFGLRELAALAATIEHLIHSEVIQRLGHAFNVLNYLPTSVMSEREADDVLETYMMIYVLRLEPTMAAEEVLQLKSVMPKIYPAWEDTKEFIHKVRGNVTKSQASAEQQASGEMDFALLAHAAETLGEQFGSFQDQECQQMKASLIKISDPGTGRVRLSEFYRPAVDGNWQFQDSAAYLRQLGALDESNPEKPRVIIPNFVTSPSNCLTSSSYHLVCCMDECEGLLNHVERDIYGSEASTTQIARVVANLPSSTVAAPRTLSPTLLTRLRQIAAEHGGMIPLHGRLFAQWMHHAFPQECKYPHVVGTTNAQTPHEWFQENGAEALATDEEMSDHVEQAKTDSRPQANSAEELPWDLVVSSPPKNAKISTLRNLAMFTAMVGIAYGLVRNPMSSSKASSLPYSEKRFV